MSKLFTERKIILFDNLSDLHGINKAIRAGGMYFNLVTRLFFTCADGTNLDQLSLKSALDAAVAAIGLIKVTVPLTPTATGVVGSWATDATYFYICTTTNVWKRIAFDVTWT